jgi:hypothetical protein
MSGFLKTTTNQTLSRVRSDRLRQVQPIGKNRHHAQFVEIRVPGGDMGSQTLSLIRLESWILRQSVGGYIVRWRGLSPVLK